MADTTLVEPDDVDDDKREVFHELIASHAWKMVIQIVAERTKRVRATALTGDTQPVEQVRGAQAVMVFVRSLFKDVYDSADANVPEHVKRIYE